MQIPLTRTTRDMKRHNVLEIIETLRRLGSATKAELAAHTGLSIATCGSVLNALCARQDVMTLTLEASRGGRPALRYACNPDCYSLLCIYAEGSDAGASIVRALFSATGELLVEDKTDFLPLRPETFYASVASALERWPNIRAIGVGLPGVVADGAVLTCDISSFIGVEIEQRLRQQTGCYVRADNDMNFAAWGLYRRHCPPGSDPVAFINFPGDVCTGCGLVVNGQLLQGASYFAGEVDKLPNPVYPQIPVAENLADILTALIAIINPATVALTGGALTQEAIEAARVLCAQRIAQRHLPTLVHRASMHKDYLCGIAELTQHSFSMQRLQDD
ncbi:transcriptional regulator [Izhakiella australiensis]|uniref:Transcriptional regulator n=1 Tax=Izhakiella australiensis TaxID=1926881 RepID=A0A1S8YGE0_9GAMM|nr:ROK family protein [Izhakiella australiensis]OON37972.1 transcriptional regulator [Izhakiella australiensis]